MYRILYNIARRLWPELEQISEQRQLVGTGDVIGFLTSLPLALGGIIWLSAVTNIEPLRSEWLMLGLLAVLMVVFVKLEYFIIMAIRSDRYGSANGSLAGVVQWTAVFLFGPTTLWLSVLWLLLNFGWNWRHARSAATRWNQARNLTFDLATFTIAYLVAIHFYQQWGGSYPISGLSFVTVIRAFGTLFVHYCMVFVIWIGYIGYVVWVQKRLASDLGIGPVLKFMLLALGLPNMAHPFAIQAAGFYVQNGIFIFLFFISGLFLIAIMARWLSWAVETSRQRSRQLEQLENLGREIINSPPDNSMLGLLLENHVPTMLPSARIAVVMYPDTVLLKKPGDWAIDLQPMCEWGRIQTQPQAFHSRVPLPWEESRQSHDPIVAAPILDVETGKTIGGIYIELRVLAQPWDREAMTSLFPALNSLAAQVASALHQAQVYKETLAYQQTLQELEFAGKIQSSFLPNELPDLNGWELAVTILPARETSGDFFDFIPLSDGKIGILIADVADKGMGAALYMALSRTLIRTYALEYVNTQPEVVFFSANERILKDSRANLFVTAFFGILDQESGTMTYCNAGHNPPYLFSANNRNKVIPLSPTGMPIGIEQDAVWKQATIKMELDDVLVLYTDGVPDAQNSEGDFFREKRLVDVAKANLGVTAQELLMAIMSEIRQFTGDEPQYDDITLLILTRCC